MLMCWRSRRLTAGLTIIELMIAIAVGAILMMAAAPSLQRWIFNTRVRSTAEAVQNGLRQAQAEAVRRSRQVVFVLTNGNPTAINVARAVDGSHWASQTVPGMTDTTAEFIRGGRLISDAAGVTVNATPNSASSICFNSIGALAAVASPPLPGGYACTVSTATPELRYIVTHPSADRALEVRVTNGGRIRMCDPARAIATSPDGC